MNSKELESELKIVITWLWRSPCLPITKLHLASYIGKTYACKWLEEGWEPSSRYKKVWSFVRDEMYIYDLLVDMYFITWELLLDYGVGPGQVKRIMRTWISKISCWRISLPTLGKLLKDLTSAILTPVADTDSGIPDRLSYNALKARMKDDYPDCYWFWHPISVIYRDWVDTGNINSFRLCYQFSEYLQRATIDAAVSASEMRNEYIAFEDKMGRESPDPKSLADFRAITRTCIDEEDVNLIKKNIVPSHGSGATSTNRKTSLLHKYSSLVELYTAEKECRRFRDFLPPQADGYYGIQPWYSEIVNVPKNLLKRRTISKEPITIQYFQHGVAYGLLKLLEDPRGMFWRHINLRRADLNGRLAAQGSIAGEFATVDLSSASDSVSVLHVRQFRRSLAELLLSVRARQTKYGDLLITLNKFAPMGADTCFKIECIVFFFCCVLAIARTNHLDVRTMTKDDFKRLIARSQFRVYGDDIVIEAQYIVSLYNVLDELGFTVNQRKSYTQMRAQNFRESCGYEYLSGTDVSPLRTPRARRYWCYHLLSADQVSALIEFHNSAYLQGLFALAKLQLKRIRKTCIKLGIRHESADNRACYHEIRVPIMGLIPFVHVDDFEEKRSALVTHYPPSNYHLWKGGTTLPEGLYRRTHWVLRSRSRADRDADRAEVIDLTKKGFSPLEYDQVAWLDWWIHRLRWNDTPEGKLFTEMTTVSPCLGCRTLTPVIMKG